MWIPSGRGAAKGVRIYKNSSKGPGVTGLLSLVHCVCNNLRGKFLALCALRVLFLCVRMRAVLDVGLYIKTQAVDASVMMSPA